MARLDNPVAQYLDASGDPVPGGKLFFFESGTSTDKDTWVDINLTIKNANPVILDGAGRIPNIFLSGTYKVILKDANDVQIWERDPVGGEAGAQFSEWGSTSIYNIEDIVRGSDDEYYQSLANNNQGNDPVTTATFWTRILFVKVWNTNESYSTSDIVRGSDGSLYKSLADSNSGNDPTTTPTSWGDTSRIQPGVPIWDASTTYDTDDFVRGSDDELYRSIPSSNIGNDPISSADKWSRIIIITEWNTNDFYAIDDVVQASDGNLYKSLVGSNLANDPVSSPSKWSDTNQVHTKPIDIGDWNMDADGTLNVAHGLAFSKIQYATVNIRNDNDNEWYPLNSWIQGTASAGSVSIDSTFVKMKRTASNFFDDVAFDSTSFNRGKIMVFYVD